MQLLNIDFSQKPKLLINNEEYSFENKITGSDHIFNNAGSQLNLKKVYPINYGTQELFKKPFKIPKYSLVELYYGDKLFYFGIITKIDKGSLNPTKLKAIDISVVSLKELLILSPIDFVVIEKRASFVVDKIIERIGISYVRKGKISFTNDATINAYNFKDMTAWDALRYIERQTNSTLTIKFNSTNKSIEINFYSENSIKQPSIGDKGVDITFDTELNANTFCDLYDIEDISWSENTQKDANVIRVESEKSVSNKSSRIEIDLSLNETSFTLPYNIAKMDKVKTKLVDSTGTEIRNVVITTQEQADNGKPSDVSYSQGSSSLNINKRLLTNYPQAKLIIWYYRELRQSIDFEDVTDQNRVKSQIKAGDGKKFRYEKYNDQTDLKDLINTGKHLLNLGVANKCELTIKTHAPIWSLGQHVEFIIGNDYEDYKDFAGDYIVKDVSIDWTVDNIGNVFAKFTYTLSDIKMVETTLNFYDSQAYRDNPVAPVEEIAIDIPTTISESVQLIVENESMECKDFSTQQYELDEELDFDLGIDSDVQETYPILRV